MNYPSWSISAEMIAYLFFGFSLFFVKRRKYLFLFSIIIALIGMHFQGMYMLTYNCGFIRGVFCFSCGVIVYKITLVKAYKMNFFELFFWPFYFFSLSFPSPIKRKYFISRCFPIYFFYRNLYVLFFGW